MCFESVCFVLYFSSQIKCGTVFDIHWCNTVNYTDPKIASMKMTTTSFLIYFGEMRKRQQTQAWKAALYPAGKWVLAQNNENENN